ncbi:alpha/beta fold hydrolase [Corynebacterium sanguinis]|uniref:alpha/beta fold hydrolase n=1 Tax=Corynebacterium sanguinis TaxID=2594913 RepID=UPI0026569B4C|nr:alpha/beta fold hydrolase [Corynebacterium sanguinis]MDN8576909.1 alpha/beta fold hydrolase [Corynebacterium sanguinis]
MGSVVTARVRRSAAAVVTASAVAVSAVLAGGGHAAAAEGSLEGSTVGSSIVTQGPVQPGAVDPFYDTSGVAPSRVGEILRTQPAPYSGILGNGSPGLPTSVDKIMYTTEDADGKLTPVTGYVLEPTVPWHGEGPRPTVVIVRGTVGQGDHCAPSRNWPLDGQPDPVYTGRTVNLEGNYDMMYASQGVRVVVTDLIGMGTPGLHTYMNRKDQAHAMLDAARAARELVESRGGQFGKVAVYGHSQGGGASAAAAEAQPEYAPDVNLVASYASAPPADLIKVQDNIDGSDLSGVIGFVVNGLKVRYPELGEIIEANVSPAGRDALEKVTNMCTNDIMREYDGVYTREWINGDRTLGELANEYPAARDAIDEQFIGNGTPQVPVMIVSGRYDQNVAYDQAKVLARAWCAKGVPVVYRDDILPAIATYNHKAQAVSGGAFGIPFILDAFHGRMPAQPTVCTNFEGNQGSSAADFSSAVSSAPLSSGLVPPGVETGMSSGTQGSGRL